MAEHEHDDAIRQRYRDLPREEPPRAVDDAILAAARRELETRPAPLVAPSGRLRWMFPVAAAAVIVLSALVTLHIQREQPDLELASAPPPTSPAPPQKDEAAAPKPPAEAPIRGALPEQGKEEASGRKEAAGLARERRQAEPQVRAKPPAPGPSPAPQMQTRPAEQAASAAPRAPEAAIAARPAPPAAAERDALVDADRARAQLGSAAKRADLAETPERMLERIAALRREGRHKEADDLYAEFRRRFPDYRIPEPMREQVLPR